MLARSARRYAKETPIGRKRRARKMAQLLAETHPDAHCELDFSTPLELAVATILSAQSTDKKVNEVTPTVFAKYRSAADYAAADRGELEVILRPTGEGRRIRAEIDAARSADAAELFARLPAADRAELGRLLRGLAD